jgi:DNA-directed RNA polymerase specialized sigma subunit
VQYCRNHLSLAWDFYTSGQAMMPAFEEEMRSLRRAMRHMLERMGWPQAAQSVASARLARDLGLPNDAVSRILDRTAADLRKLSAVESEDVDARPIIDRAVNDLSKLGIQSRPFEEAAVERYLQELPERDYQILRYFKAGKKHSEIAALMDTDVEDVRNSLVKTYADLRIKMISAGDDGGGVPASELPPSSTLVAPPLKQTSLRQH